MFHMNDDYKRGLVTGLAMQPLYVAVQHNTSNPDNFCGALVTLGIMSDDAFCKQITYEEE